MRIINSYIVLLLLCSAQWSFAQQHKPNIILIIADDLGYKDLGFMGGEHFHSPNLDALAKQAHVYYQAYAGAANCAPSRASLLTGLNTPRHGIYTVGNSAQGKTADRKIIPIANTDVLNEDLQTMADFLSKQGYQTASIGKWHVGETPLNYGFQYNFAGNHQGHNKHFSPYNNPDIPDGEAGEYLTDRVTDEALRYMKQTQAEKPYFMYLSYFAVHTPIQAPDSLVQQYAGKKGTGTEDYPTYAAMVHSLDQNIGRIVQQIKDSGQADNTLLIFCSDNGGINFISPQSPLRAGKGSYYEGGIRIPMFFHWPAKIKAQQDEQSIISLLDVFPTLVDLLNPHENKPKLDGQSLWPTLQNGKSSQSTLYWHYPIYLRAYNPQVDDGRDPLYRTRPGTAIRHKNWKMQYFYEDKQAELYDLNSDIGERHNLAQEQPRTLRKLKKMMKAWIEKTKAPIPTELNPDYQSK